MWAPEEKKKLRKETNGKEGTRQESTKDTSTTAIRKLIGSWKRKKGNRYDNVGAENRGSAQREEN